MNNNAQQFENWIKHSCRAYSNHAKMVFAAMEEINVVGGKSGIDNPGPMKAPICTSGENSPTKNVPQDSRGHLASANSTTNVNSAKLIRREFDEKSDVTDDTTDDMLKVRDQFFDQLHKANKNLLKLQNEFGKLHHMSLEFDGMVETLKTSKHPGKMDDLKKIKKSMDSMNKRMDAITSNQDEVAAMILKLDSRTKQQFEADKKNFELILPVLERMDTQLGQFAKDEIVSNNAMKEDFENALSNQTNSILSSIVCACIINCFILVTIVY